MMFKKLSIVLILFNILFFAFAQNTPNQWQDKASDLIVPTEEQLFKNDPDPSVLSAQINVRLKKIQKSIPLDYNAHVQKYIDFYTSRTQHIAKVLGRAEKFFPIFEPILAQYGIPDEMKYLAVVESALNPFAKSPVGATGPWQFMYGTGLQYGLAINKRIDERKDPYKSCDAAARYLKYMYNIYGNWHLAIASYNCGPGNVNKAINKAGGSKNYWDIKPFLPKETQAYVPSYIATVYAMKYAKNFGVSPMKLDREATQRITIREKLTVTDLEKIINIPKEVIIEENPSLLTTLIPANFTLNIPKDRVQAFNYYQDSLYAFAEDITTGEKLAAPVAVKPSSDNTKQQPTTGDYTTIPVVEKSTKSKKKEEQSKKTEELAVKKKTEKAKNDEAKKTLAEKKKEEELLAKKAQEQKDKNKNLKNNEKQETLTKEEYLNKKREELTQKNAIAPKSTISQINNNSSTITKIELPEFLKEDDSEYKAIVYKVNDGDNLGFIAKWFHVSVSEIKRWNEMQGILLNINQELVIYVHKKDYNRFVQFNNLSFRLKNLLSENIQTQEEIQAKQNQSKEKSKKPFTQKINPINYFRNKDCFEMYEIKSGENLWTLAQKYDEVSVQNLMEWNDYKKTPLLKPGDKIKVRKIECK